MFEVFEKSARKPASWPEATILRKGSLQLNAVARHLLGEAELVELLYDRERKVIGLRPSTTASENSYKLSTTPGGLSTVSLISFLKFYEIDVTESRRRIPTLDHDVLCIDLKEPGVVVDRKTR